MTEAAGVPLSHSSENITIQACSMQLKAIKDWRGEELDDLTFKQGDVITVSKKDGAGWAFGSLADGTKGWFPLEVTELLHESAVAAIGTHTGESALDAFIKEAKERPVPLTNLHLARATQGQAHRNHSLNELLASKPMHEQVVPVSESMETSEEIEAAQRRLMKLQKKRKKERADVLIENLRSGWKPTVPYGLTEEQFDRLVTDVVYDIPLTRDKYHFTSYEDVFSGNTLIQNLRAHAHRVSSMWEKGLSTEGATTLAQNLLERNVIVDVADPGRKKFKPKCLYQCHGQQPDYSVLNFDKICASQDSVDGYALSIQLVGEMIEIAKKFLPSMERMRKSKELRAFGLRIAALQQVRLDGMSADQQKIFFINVHNAAILYTHAKLTPPTNTADKRFVYEHCSIYTNQRRYSIQDLENEVFQFATKSNPWVYFCISDCTKSTPAIFIFSEDNFEMIKHFAIRHFLNRTLIVDSSNYEITCPKVFQRMWKDMGYEKEKLIELIAPYCSKEQREDIQQMSSVGPIDLKFHAYEFEPCYVFEEASPLSPR